MNDFNDHIELNTAVMFGKPFIKGTRITVENIIGELAAGYTMEYIIAAQPRIKKENIIAALHYATAILKSERIYLAAS